MPFNPKLTRIQRASQELATILGHSIRIELDGALLPQTREGAEDVIASLVEDVARDLDAIAKEDAKALAFAKEKVERVSVRYAPADAAAREERWRGSSGVALDLGSKTVDVARPEASWRALERGEIARAIHRAFASTVADRYAHVLPDRLPSAEHRAWFDYHAHGAHPSSKEKTDHPYARVGSIDGLRTRGMVMLHYLAKSDGALSRDVRAWLVDAMSDFASTYHHHAAEVESAPQGSSYRLAESAYVGWLRAELSHMTLDERGKIAAHLWVTDFRKDHGERDRYATYSFPGLDPMAFSFETIDAWIAAGHPPNDATRDLAPVFETVVCPASVETKHGQRRYGHTGRCDGTFYQWALVDRSREDLLVERLLARADVPLATAAFYNARRVLRDEPDYLRFLRRFEATPALWRVGADVHREVVFRPSTALLEESRRLWREVASARGHVLLWFARHVEGSYRPEGLTDLLQGSLADERTLTHFLGLGWDGFDMLPAAWPALARSSGRARVITREARALLTGADAAPPGLVGKLVAIARILCDEGSMGELAELRSFAEVELRTRPGGGFSDLVTAADPTKCQPKPRPAVEARTSRQ